MRYLVAVRHTDVLVVNRAGGATVYNCTYADSWCCDSGLVYGGCCSNPSNFLNIGAGKNVTQVGAAPVTSSTTVSTQTSASITSQSSSSSSPPTTPSSSSANSTTATQSGSGQTSTTSGQVNSGTPPSSNLGVKVGAGVGIPAGIALVGALIYIVYLTRRNKRNQQLLNELAGSQGQPGEDESRAGPPLSFYSATVAPSEMAESNVQLGEATGAELPAIRH